ncbi:MAG: PQQ-binding-like beta-propeller repeat protein [Planctomycetia bacterium]|nr:PQQ-binding-like beta-propeller repeat protein [Planctomycetia bacterium]
MAWLAGPKVSSCAAPPPGAVAGAFVQVQAAEGPKLPEAPKLPEDEDELVGNVFPQPDRAVLRRLSTARKLLDEKRYGEAVRHLGLILESPEDYFFQPDTAEPADQGQVEEAARPPDEKPSRPDVLTPPAQGPQGGEKPKKPRPHSGEDTPPKAPAGSPGGMPSRPAAPAATYRSLKREAERLLGAMPRQGHELYELQFGAQARQMLRQAAETGDAVALAEVSRRFFHTEAGYEATLLLGLYHLDHGQPLAAALALSRLRDESRSVDRFEPTLSLAMGTCWLQAGLADRAAKVLDDLRRRRPDATAWIGGKETPLFGEGNSASRWLLAQTAQVRPERTSEPRQWTMVGGNPARNASSSGSAPLLNVLWRIPVSDYPIADGILQSRGQGHAQLNLPLLPRFEPLAVDNVVLMRSLRTLLAIDFNTGKRLWETPGDDPLDDVSERSRATFGQPAQVVEMVCQRAWTDGIYGALSSDGRLVFSIEGLDFGNTSRYVQQIIIRNGRRILSRAASKPSNRLAAHEIASGKQVWEIGGVPVKVEAKKAEDGEKAEEAEGTKKVEKAEKTEKTQAGRPGDKSEDAEEAENAASEADTFFLGAPLPLMGRLYELAEVSGEIRLLALETATGKLLWSQQIAMVEQDVLRDESRRQAAVSPSYGDGVLVCPTANGAIVAIELATRSLLWGYQYAQKDPRRVARRVIAGGMMVPGSPVTAGMTSWSDAHLILVDGRVLATQPESDELHCLSLIDGKLLWKCPRDEDLYVACVDEGTIVLVGPRQARAIRLDDGRPAWEGRTVALPEQSVPSGRGFAAAGMYYLPLSTADVLVLDVKAGKSARVFKSRGGTVPGNLICHQGKVLSQGLDGLVSFHQLEALGKQVEQTLAKTPDDPTALGLRGEILLDSGMRDEAIDCLRRAYGVAQSPKTRTLLRDALLDGLGQQFEAYRTRTAEIEPLLDEPHEWARYLRLMAVGFEQAKQWTPALEYYLKLADVARDRPCRELMPVSESLSARPDRWLRARLAALRPGLPADARKALDDAVTGRLVSALKSPDAAPLERFVACFGSLPAADEARAQLVRRLAKANRVLEAELILERARRSPDAKVAGRATAELASLLHDAKRIEDAAVCYRRLARGFSDTVCLDGKTGRQLVDALPADDPARKHLDAVRQWPVGHVEITESAPVTPATGPQFNPGMARVGVVGHLLLASLGNQYYAIDSIAEGAPKVLWSQELNQQIQLPGVTLPPGMPAFPPQFGGQMIFDGAYSRGIVPDSLRAFTGEVLCYRRLRHCVAVDPLTGETLWIQRNIPLQSRMFGDEEFIFVVEDGKDEAVVLRALDGERLPGTRLVPRADQWIATLGRNVLVWRPLGDKRVLELSDPWQQRILWGPYEFSANAKFDRVDDEAIGVMEPDGHFVLVSISDGKKRLDTRLEPEPTLHEIVILDSPDRYTLVTHALMPSRRMQTAQPLQGTSSKMIRNGRVYAFDREGKRLWPDYPKGVVVENQQLPVDQPGDLPVVLFAGRTYDPRNPDARWSTTALVLDKRTGRTLVNKRYSSQTNSFEFAGDPEKNSVALTLQDKVIALTFTDKPISPDERPWGENPSALDGPLPKTLDAMLKALHKAGGQP